MATIGAPDVEKVRQWYTEWLDYDVRETGAVSKELAESWGAPKAAGRKFITMSSDGAPDVLVRVVETDPVKGYQPLTTWGWNSFEIVVDNVEAIYAKLQKSPFKIIGTPHPLTGIPSIHAMQILGPASEVLYLTQETGDRAKSPLPLPNAFVGRPFILVVAGPDLPRLVDWYAEAFHMQKGSIHESPIGVLRDAQKLPDAMYPLTTLRLKQQGNLMELDGYPVGFGARPHAAGQLPPGNALATFSVARLEGVKVKFIAPPQELYGKIRAATFVGPAGELTELIEDPAP
jgi:hypothetical protein